MESYENVIWDLVEDRIELGKETKETIKAYEKDVSNKNWQNFVSFDNIKKGMERDV